MYFTSAEFTYARKLPAAVVVLCVCVCSSSMLLTLFKNMFFRSIYRSVLFSISTYMNFFFAKAFEKQARCNQMFKENGESFTYVYDSILVLQRCTERPNLFNSTRTDVGI